ncbi:hypothetical protein EYZ11_002204 [Aspergillus tanneri]|uniref:N-acetyltransferase domain-containing protein n=1 Tax=Aspergillus tanneri TaxID=1220188 RepID=A0A4S3JRD6_9EURO|nr:uncharacterized protein ATNIH1004_008947 [Aspergillus tanneri]KAA8644740.1 hypothetical protein ATNIH1004_008947 [Aspergillus tanneri]THC98343.1 hypothetical protein EYZ11_002204 [Aspergillus tanneri]
MPAVHEDLASAVIPTDTELSPEIYPRQVTLRDRVTVATLVPFSSADDVPRSLLAYLSDQLNKEIEKGDTYAMIDLIPLDNFGPYWFSNFGAIMLLGDIKSVQEMQAMDRAGVNWPKICLGSFNVRPNYPGRSSHVCNGMFLVTDAARNRGVGRLMGEMYLEWAPRLGYTYAVFNLVYESNVASCRIWDALGFKRIGKVPGGGRLLSNPGQYVDAIIYGRDLGPEGGDSLTQDRFDKIRYYLKHSKYPRGADRAEKSRLRSAATHYKLVGGTDGDAEKLMLKDKEVVSDPQQQYEIARDMHVQQHAGINKTTAAIAVKYHWVRIKETVSRVIRDCPQCKETLKLPMVNGLFQAEDQPDNDDQPSAGESDVKQERQMNHENHVNHDNGMKHPSDMNHDSGMNLPSSAAMGTNPLLDHTSLDAHQSHNPFVTAHPSIVQGPVDPIGDYTAMPLDPQIIDIHHQLPRFQTHDAMTDPYAHDPHALASSHFDDDVRHHAAHDYHMMVDDPGDAGAALHQEALGLVHSQATDVHHEQILAKYQYVGPTDDDLDFT